MNYRHAFHAGNFADVHKHTILIALLDRLTRKPKPLFFLDTHAGRGRYDLQSNDARRSDESQAGIDRLRMRTPVSADIARYLALAGLSAGEARPVTASYPGSPLLALAALRDGDRAVFVEQQTEEARILRNETRHQRNVSVVCGDGYAALPTYLPPKENRGLVLIDPPYEAAKEFDTVARALDTFVGRWSNGVCAVWYPLKSNRESARFLSTLQQSGIRRILSLELLVRPADSPLGLNGSGMIIINPPWQLDLELRSTMDELHASLAAEGAHRAKVQWLVGE
jgi:23S rRNA (adenine2030-N6)-methyltransferase